VVYLAYFSIGFVTYGCYMAWPRLFDEGLSPPWEEKESYSRGTAFGIAVFFWPAVWALILFYSVLKVFARMGGGRRPGQQSRSVPDSDPKMSPDIRREPSRPGEDICEWARRAYDRLQAHGHPDPPYSMHQMLLIGDVARERQAEFLAKSDFGPCPKCGCTLTSVSVVGSFDASPTGGGDILGTTCSSCDTELRTLWGLNPDEELHWKESK